MARIVCALAIAMAIGCGGPETDAASIPEVTGQKPALETLRGRVEADAIYAQWSRPGCLIYMIEASEPHYYDMVVREKHGSGCPGDAGTSPVVDRFRLYRDSDTLLWFDVVGDRYLSYPRFKRERGSNTPEASKRR